MRMLAFAILLAAAPAASPTPTCAPEAEGETPASACAEPSACEARCNCGEADACNRLALAARLGVTVRQNWSRSMELYERACDYGSGAGCRCPVSLWQ